MIKMLILSLGFWSLSAGAAEKEELLSLKVLVGHKQTVFKLLVKQDQARFVYEQNTGESGETKMTMKNAQFLLKKVSEIQGQHLRSNCADSFIEIQQRSSKRSRKVLGCWRSTAKPTPELKELAELWELFLPSNSVPH